MTKLRVAVLDALDRERERQIAMGYTPAHDDLHSNPHEWAAYILAYLGRAVHPYSQEGWRDNLVKAGALIVAALEQAERMAWTVEGDHHARPAAD